MVTSILHRLQGILSLVSEEFITVFVFAISNTNILMAIKNETWGHLIDLLINDCEKLILMG